LPDSLPNTLVQDGLCLLICFIAAVSDIKSYRIPNWLTFGGILCGFAANTLLLENGWLVALAGGLLCAIVFGLLGAVNFVGMGDVKLMVAVGTILGVPLALYALVYVGLAGGMVALGYAIGRRELAAVFGNLGRMARSSVERSAPEASSRLHRIPYGVAIMLGSLVAVAARYYPPLLI
jgi:prepilin peptidase CpaA